MARSFNSITPDYLQVENAPVTAPPLTLACWFSGDQGVLLNVCDGTATDRGFSLLVTSTQVVRVATGNRVADSTTTFTDNMWNHACGVITSPTLRAAFLNGGGKGTNTQNNVPSEPNRTSLGRYNDFTPGNNYTGNIAEAGIWNTNLTDAEVAILAAGYAPPFVRPSNLVFYLPLVRDDDEDVAGGLSLSASGSPGIGAHSRIIYPAQKHYSFPAGIKSITSEIDLHSKGHQIFASSWHPDTWENRL